MDNTPANLIHLIELFAERTKKKPSTISRHATGSGGTIKRLKKGRRITTERAYRAAIYLSKRWPTDLEWPADIPRPNINRKSEGANA